MGEAHATDEGHPIARQSSNTAIVEDTVTRLLRRRRLTIRSAIVMAIIAIGSAVWSHFRAPPEARELDAQTVAVRRVVDGDTIIVDTPAGEERVRLRGIDAPELSHDDVAEMYYGPEARRYLTSRLDGKRVVLKMDSTETRDRFGRILAFVYLGESDCVNLDLVRDGMAYMDRRFKNYMESQLAQAETQARAKKIGLWKDVKTENMPPWRQRWLTDRNRPNE